MTVNLYQYLDGHLMVIPRRHIESLAETNQKEWQAIFYLLNLGVKKLQDKLKINDIYILDRPLSGFFKTGKTVAHSHFHIIPYKPELVSWHYQKVSIHPKASKAFALMDGHPSDPSAGGESKDLLYDRFRIDGTCCKNCRKYQVLDWDRVRDCQGRENFSRSVERDPCW